MSKLDRAIQEAEQNNAGTKAVEEVKGRAKNKAKEKTKDAAKKTAKKAIKGVHGFLSKHSRVYRAGSTLAKAGVKAVGAALKSFIAFLATPPVGWIVSAIIITLIISVMNSGALDNLTNNPSSGMGGMTENIGDDDLLLYHQNACPIIEYDGSVSDGVGDTDWTTPGTTAYHNAEKIFKFWVDRGFSGAGAAGIIGWTNSEGGFTMFGRGEGLYSSDPKKASLMYGNVPIPYGDYAEGGGGVYQFTPYSKFAPLGSPDWENPDKINQFVVDKITHGDWNASMDMTGDNNSFNNMAKATDPQYASLIWMAYERADASTVDKDEKKRDAQIAYDIFQGSHYRYSEERFAQNFGRPTGDGENGQNQDKSNHYDPCAHLSGVSWRGAGGQPSIKSGMWTVDGLPDEMREYALDPQSVGMFMRRRDAWPILVSPGGTGGQCTDLAASLMNRLWVKDGEHPDQRRGNGKDVAGNWASKYGGSVTTKPSAGAVFSSGQETQYGHTGVVSHVFDNGDFLIIEQNVTGFSGDSANDPLTWNYRYIQKSASSGFTFFDPSTVGFNLVSGITSH